MISFVFVAGISFTFVIPAMRGFDLFQLLLSFKGMGEYSLVGHMDVAVVMGYPTILACIMALLDAVSEERKLKKQIFVNRDGELEWTFV